MVGRPSKGSGARSEVFSVRVTPQEVGALAARFGSVAKGLRHLIDDWLRTEPVRKGRATVATEDIAAVYGVPVDVVTDGGGMPVVSQETGRTVIPSSMRGAVAFEDDDPAPHRHRRGPVIRVDFDKGQPKNVYACVECQEELG